MLSIEYDVAIPDLVAFNEFHCRRTPAMRRRFRMMQFAAPALWLALAAASRVVGKDSFYRLWLPTGLLLCAVVWPLWFSWNYRRSLRKCVAKFIGGGQGMVGRHRLALEEDALVERTEGSETRTRWSALGEVCEDAQYVYVYISALAAHVIPRAAFGSDALRTQFVAELERLRAQAKAA
jgi:hypothetical protein